MGNWEDVLCDVLWVNKKKSGKRGDILGVDKNLEIGVLLKWKW